MASTITLKIFVSKLCHLSLAQIDTNLVHPTNVPDPNTMPSTLANVNLAQPNGNERRPEVDSYLQNRHIMRDKRNIERSDEEYSRLARAEKNLIRFGRNENSKGNGFIRFGRSDKGLIRFGRNDNSEAMRFGRRGDKFIRFGRSNGGGGSNRNSKDDFMETDNVNAIDNSFQLTRPISRPGRNENYIRFGRGEKGLIRFGKRNEEFKYAQGKTTSDDFDSAEKLEDATIGQNDIAVPLQMYLYDVLRKEKDLATGKDIESKVSPGTPSDDDYLMNVKLNYDDNLLKNNLL